jgi:hypothetical protein
LFAGGYWSVHKVWQVRRWSDGGRGPFVDIPSAPNVIMQIVGLKDDRMLFASAKSFGLIQADAKAVQRQGFGALHLAPGRDRCGSRRPATSSRSIHGTLFTAIDLP